MTKHFSCSVSFGAALCLPLLAVGAVRAQNASATVAAVRPLALHRRVSAGQPFTVAGPSGLIVGQQEGTFEAWVLPVKVLSQMHLTAEVDGYPVPIDLNRAAAEIDVTPGHTTITYSHIALTVRQTMFAPEAGDPAPGAVVVFTVEAVRPVTLTFSFTPEMRAMWPRPGGGAPSAEWVGSASAYVLHTNFPDLSGAVALPSAQPGVLAPYQEKPQTHPLEFKLRYDPARDHGKRFPLLMAVGQTAQTASNDALLSRLAQMQAGLAHTLSRNEEHYASLQRDLTSIQTPDAGFDDAFRWAEISIEQLRARLMPSGETGLVAGYYASGDTARPGFGWFFGRDALYTVPAIDAAGDFRLTRETLDFLLARQRADGKIMHEYSQTANQLSGSMDWASLPYFYAAADATPLLLMAMLDYMQSSGDVSYLQRHRDAVLKAWQFEATHDSDGDGVYDNAEGTGWVESWPGGQPHQEIYLALLDRQASGAMSALATMLGEPKLAQSAEVRASRLAETIEHEYYLPATGDYAFSRNGDGSLDRTATIYPSLAWWAGGPGLQHPDASMRRWNSHDFATDWGARDVAESDRVYDPISYHQGSVWPLFTGWTSMADYRSGRPLAGYAALRHNADQTYTQDLGAVTELLSGAYFQPFGRSTSHQLWSSAMVITPALRGLFGITVDGAGHTITVAPQLPADWPSAMVRNLHVGRSVCNLSLARVSGRMEVRSETLSGPTVLLNSTKAQQLSLPLPAVEAALYQPLPAPGAATSQAKVLAESAAPHALTLELEGRGGTQVELLLRTNADGLNLRAEGAVLGPLRSDGMRTATVTFGPGSEYVAARVTLRW